MKILLLDIETSPNTAHVWGLFNQTVSLKQLMESSRTMCWAAKWYGEKRVRFMSEYHDDKSDMLGEIHAMLDEADAVVHYNGRRFDIPTLNKEFLLHGMLPPAPYKQVDLLQHVRRQFRFPSNKLAYVAKALGLVEKVEHEGHELWVKCMVGDDKAWKTMRRYNKGDVITLEEVYDVLMPWIPSHPNHNVYSHNSTFACPNCGSGHVQRRGTMVSNTRTYQRFQCQGCGKWSKSNRCEPSKPVLVGA